jgi:hydrogenase nickel incorporation protein HypA/HybF
MHEYSLVRALLEQVREAAAPHADADLKEVVISIGLLAGVEPVLVASAFASLVRDTAYSATQLVVEHTALRLLCQRCGCEYETMEVAFHCPVCSSVHTQVIDGDSVVLRRLVLSERQTEEATS